jgi:hypothetical protein
VDNRRGSGRADISFLALAGESFINGTAARDPDPAGQSYTIRFRMAELGMHVLAIYLDGRQVANSPFLFSVTRRLCQEYQGRVSDMNGNCVCADQSTFEIGGICLSLVWPIVFVVFCLLVIGVALLVRRALRQDEDEIRRAASQLRSRLQLTRAEGFVLSSDVYPVWRKRASLVFVQRSHLEAAARLTLFRDDCDVKLLNGLCVCLLERSHQYALLCEWLLELSNNLLDPGIHITLQAPTVNQKRVSAAELRRVQGRVFHDSIKGKVFMQEDRFVYFVEKICKVHVLQDAVVFEKLQHIAQLIMDKMADLCDECFANICSEPSGAELLASKFSMVQVLSPSSMDSGGSEQLLYVADSLICRQDQPQVALVA